MSWKVLDFAIEFQVHRASAVDMQEDIKRHATRSRERHVACIFIIMQQPVETS